MNFAKMKASNGTKLADFGLEEFAIELVQSALVPIIRHKFEEYKDVDRFDDIYAKTVYYTVRFSATGKRHQKSKFSDPFFRVSVPVGDGRSRLASSRRRECIHI
jgi:hypothetical protein